MLDLTKYDSLGVALRAALDRWPDEICLIEADRDRERSRLTYQQFREAAEPLAAALEDSGFAAGDRAASIMTNQPKWLISASAVFIAGGGPTGKSDGGGAGGSWPGAVEQNRGPHLTSVLLIQRSERCTAYRFPPAPTAAPPPHRARYGVPLLTRTPTAGTPPQFSPSAVSSPSPPACGPRFETFRRAARPHRTSPLLSSPHVSEVNGTGVGGGAV